MKATIAVLDKRGNNTTLSSHDKQHCVRLGDATVLFDGRIYSPTSGASGTEIIAKKLQQADPLKASEAFLKEVEGDFAFIIAEPERIIAGRDPVGVQPLYYGENRGFAALASNHKALWKLGVDEAQSFPPGHLASVSREGFKFTPVKTLVYS
jgi:asparagine synthetase B (glutamine-hydrolysing)